MRFEHMHVLAASLAVVGVGLSATGSPIEREPLRTMNYQMTEAVQDTIFNFSRDVFPILERTCLRCHGGAGEDGEVVVEEGLDMTTYDGLMAGSLYGTVVEPGDPDNSYLLELIVAGDMPKEGDLLTPEEIETIRQWIAAGAQNN